MLWRTYLLNRLVGDHDVRFIVGRHPVVYAKVLVQYTAVFLILFLLHRVVRFRVPTDIMQIVFGSLVGIGYLIAIYMLLRSYFDVMVATDVHLYIVFRDSFYKYRIKIVSRQSIQDISVVPADSMSAVFKDGHITIATEQDETIEFRHVYQPTLVAKKLYHICDMVKAGLHEPVRHHHEPEKQNIDDEKFKVLVETLGEVIVDYMKKKD